MRLEGSTTRARFAADSRRCPVDYAPIKSELATRREVDSLSRDEAKLVERALQHVYRVVIPSILRRASPGWGPGPLSSERNWEFFVQLGEELGEWPQRLFRDQDPTGKSIRRIERSHREEAAGELATIVRGFPVPIRRVVEARALGVSWQKITRTMPDRAYFSIVEDWQVALATLHYHHGELVERLT